LPGLFPTDNTDKHRFLFTNTNQSNRMNLFCALTGRNPLRIFIIISGSSSRKYFWADRFQRLSWWFSKDFCTEGAWGENQNGGQSIGYAKLCVISFAQ